MLESRDELPSVEGLLHCHQGRIQGHVMTCPTFPDKGIALCTNLFGKIKTLSKYDHSLIVHSIVFLAKDNR